MKCHHPDVFCCALLNAQPMGFYAPAQIVRDAREHGVEVRPPCINASEWDSTLEGGEGPLIPLRLGLRVVRGLAAIHAEAILAARTSGHFRSIEDAWLRSGVPVAALERLAEADAFRGLGFDRRQALWQVKGLGEKQLPLFAAAEAREAEREPKVQLTPMTAGREVVEDYHSTQLTLRDHPLTFLRPELERRGIIPCASLAHVKNGRKVEVAGIILVRQKPGSAKGVLFITIEDETGIANGIIWPARFEAQRRVVLSSAMIGIKGTVQREGPVIHVIADRIEDYTPLLRTVGERDFPHRPGPGDGATHPGAPDARDAKSPRQHDWERRVRDSYHSPFRTGADPEEIIRQKSRDFH
jgi:error-prone DNA polymerase